MHDTAVPHRYLVVAIQNGLLGHFQWTLTQERMRFLGLLVDRLQSLQHALMTGLIFVQRFRRRAGCGPFGR